MLALPDLPTKPDSRDLLAWYDRHRRDLPWRAKPGEAVDPYRVWLSEIMLQQTTIAAVRPYFARFLDRFPTVEALAAAPSEAVMQAWAGLGYYSRARNLHACAQAVVSQHDGAFPPTAAGLRDLPGIGPYTSGAIGAIAFGEPVAAVDGNVERVIARLYRVSEPLRGAKARIRDLTQALVPAARPGDFAQALMDLGATICTPKRPACALCPWMAGCQSRAEGSQESFPRKAAKAEGVLRRGAAFLARRNDGSILLRIRPPKGLLGGMDEVPTTDWTAGFDLKRALDGVPVGGDWRRLPGVVRHVFTHFPLELTVFVATVPDDTASPHGSRWVAWDALSGAALPSLVRKVIAHGTGEKV